MAKPHPEECDLVVVGAGLYGIAAACIYHQLHPTARLLLVDSASSVGGPWATHRIFPGLKTNNLWGTYEFPDFPMHEEKFGVKKGEHVPAEKVAEYLEAMIEESGIQECLRLQTMVEVVEKVGENEGWNLHCSKTGDKNAEQGFVIRTNKLILSTGLTNQPRKPKYPISAKFSPTIIHSKDFPSHYSEIVKEGTHTLVIGAGKSAWDIAYACATTRNASVTMLTRSNGNGPTWMAPPHVTPLGLWLEKLVFTRFFGFMSPCVWAETSGFEGWIRRLLHGTWLGRKIVAAFWGVLSDDVVQLNKYNDHAETKKLRPWRSAFEVGNSLSILNYPTNFFDLVKDGKIKVLVDEVQELGEGKEVVLKGGVRLEVDAVVCATGWEAGPAMKFKPKGLEKELGLPSIDQSVDKEDMTLVKMVESGIYKDFPILKRDTSRVFLPDQDLRHTQIQDDSRNEQPYRLYRFLVPLSDLPHRTIGFAGALMTLGNAPCAYLQGLWLAAYLDGTLPLPTTSPSELRHETYRETQYCALRYTMGYSNKYPDLVFDSLPYFDLLMQDLGFEGKRKGRIMGLTNWGSECFRSYGPEDYKGLVEQWARRNEGGVEGKKNM